MELIKALAILIFVISMLVLIFVISMLVLIVAIASSPLHGSISGEEDD